MRPIPVTIFTTLDGVIEWVDRAGSDLLHISTAACRGRELIRFFGANRVDVLRAIEDACAGEVVQGTGLIRPRERRPVAVTYTVGPDPEDGESLKWVFETEGVS